MKALNHLSPEILPGGAPPGARPADWEKFIAARTADERSRAWLSLLCGGIPGAKCAAVLVESVEAGTFVPIAVWPEASLSLGRLGPAVQTALAERRGVIRPLVDEEGILHLAYPLMLDQRIDGVVVLEAACDTHSAEGLMRDIHWGSAWLGNLLGARELDEAICGRDRMASVLEACAVILRHGKLKQVLFEISNDLRQRLDCTRVAVGLAEDAVVQLAALSEAATFERRTPLARAYVDAMEEAHDRASVITLSADSGPETRPAPAHRALLTLSGARFVISQPLLQGTELIGVLTLERTERAFGDDDLIWLDAFAVLTAPIIAQRKLAERSSLGRLWYELKGGLQKVFGPRHLIWKTGVALVVLSVTLLALVTVEYRVSAKTVIEGEVQRVAAAPFEGFLVASHVRAGDTVKAGQELARLDDRELLIEQARWASERDQYDGRLREAAAAHELSSIQVLSAQRRQAEAQWALVKEKIERSHIRAPYDGLVVSGDLSQLVGSPVEPGKKLFEIAPLESYRIILQVDEREIRHIADKQVGRLVMTGIAGEAMDFSVAKLTPVATAQDGKNFFRVEAKLADASPRLRPGMEGVGKISVGNRSLWWILTHGFSDWLRLSVWTWMP